MTIIITWQLYESVQDYVIKGRISIPVNFVLFKQVPVSFAHTLYFKSLVMSKYMVQDTDQKVIEFHLSQLILFVTFPSASLDSLSILSKNILRQHISSWSAKVWSELWPTIFLVNE